MMSEKYSIGVSGDHENDLDYYNKNLKGDTLIIVGLDSSVAYETTPQEIYDALKKVRGEVVVSVTIGESCSDCKFCDDEYGTRTKGTITWLPIEDAPKDGSEILVAQQLPHKGMNLLIHVAHYVRNDMVGDSWSNGDRLMNPKFITHFAYINEPEEQNGTD